MLGLPQSQWIVGPYYQLEFQMFFRDHWLSIEQLQQKASCLLLGCAWQLEDVSSRDFIILTLYVLFFSERT